MNVIDALQLLRDQLAAIFLLTSSSVAWSRTT